MFCWSVFWTNHFLCLKYSNHTPRVIWSCFRKPGWASTIHKLHHLTQRDPPKTGWAIANPAHYAPGSFLDIQSSVLKIWKCHVPTFQSNSIFILIQIMYLFGSDLLHWSPLSIFICLFGSSSFRLNVSRANCSWSVFWTNHFLCLFKSYTYNILCRNLQCYHSGYFCKFFFLACKNCRQAYDHLSQDFSRVWSDTMFVSMLLEHTQLPTYCVSSNLSSW